MSWFSLRRKIIERDEFKCCFCGSKDKLEVHHVRPKSRNGKDETWNLITLCSTCHDEEHRSISRHGLSTVPGPDFEPYRFLITNREDVLKYAGYLESVGVNADEIRSTELHRM